MNPSNQATYVDQIEAWRRQREVELRAPDGWLPLTGLYLLEDGRYTVGSIGAIDFELQGRELQLMPSAGSTPDQLSVVLRDATAGEETYGAARFLSPDVAQDGGVVLDFNKAYNPPCAFTPYATCPLPPCENIIPIRIAAGELHAG